ncbi:Cysteine--tRNA ligase [subsurface metagenome]
MEKLKILYEMDKVLGLDIAKLKLQDEEIDEQIKMLIKERDLARAGKDFRRADKIRAELKGRGIILRDTPSGTGWRKKQAG